VINGREIKQEREKEAKTKKYYHLITKNTIEIRRIIGIEMVIHIITKSFRVLRDNSVNIT
jgi:hypothetical protein